MGISIDPGRLILGGVLVTLLLKSCPASYSYPFLQPSGKIHTVCKTQRRPVSRASAVTPVQTSRRCGPETSLHPRSPSAF